MDGFWAVSYVPNALIGERFVGGGGGTGTDMTLGQHERIARAMALAAASAVALTGLGATLGGAAWAHLVSGPQDRGGLATELVVSVGGLVIAGVVLTALATAAGALLVRHRALHLLASATSIDDAAHETAEERARLSWQAFHDPLTGLANRALLQDRLSHALQRSRRGRELTGLLFIDLDHFKAVNDTMGHDGGDRVLVEMASRLAQAVRGGDTVARMGGDEFVVLTETLTVAAEAEIIAQRVIDALHLPVHLDGSDVTITCSIGIAFDDVHNPDLLLRDADLALYQAKALGRGRYVVFSHGDPTSVSTPS